MSRLTSDSVRQELQRFATEFAKGQLHEELQVLGNRIEQTIHNAIRQQQDELDFADNIRASAILKPITEESNSTREDLEPELGWLKRNRRVSMPPDLEDDNQRKEREKRRTTTRKSANARASTASAFNARPSTASVFFSDRDSFVSAVDKPSTARNSDASEPEAEVEIHSFMNHHRKSYMDDRNDGDLEESFSAARRSTGPSIIRPSTAPLPKTSIRIMPDAQDTSDPEDGTQGKKKTWWSSDAEEAYVARSFGYTPLLRSSQRLSEGPPPDSTDHQDISGDKLSTDVYTCSTEFSSEIGGPDSPQQSRPTIGGADSPQQNRPTARWGRPTTAINKRPSGVEILMPLRFVQGTRMVDVVQSSTYAYCSGALIMASVACIGIQTDYMARCWMKETPRVFRICDQFFCFFFTVDILLRLCGLGLKFWTNQDWRWNILDLLVTTVQVMEEILHLSTHLAKHFGGELFLNFISILRTARIFRMIRVLRLVRIVRVLNWVGELRMILVSVIDGMRSLCWTILVVALLVYVVGVYLTQCITDLKVRDNPDKSAFMEEPDERALEELFGTLDRSMLSLYESISDGLHWGEVIGPLRRCCSPWLSFLFCGYIAFVMLAMLNVVTGVFVESAIQAANDDKKKVLMYQIRSLFTSADVDESGTITWDEFKLLLDDEKMQMYLRAIDLGEEEARELFRLLDIDDCGEIPFEEFVNGCLRLHGFAKSIDLAAFMHEYRRATRISFSHMSRIESKLTRIITYFSETGCLPSRRSRPSIFSGSQGTSVFGTNSAGLASMPMKTITRESGASA